jgi:hypothetical protein
MRLARASRQTRAHSQSAAAGGGGVINGGWNGLSNDGRQIGFVIANNVMTDIVVSGRVGNCIFTTHVFNQTFAVSGNSFTFTRTPGGSLDPGFTFTATMSGNTATGTVVLTSNDSNCSGNSATITWTTTNSGVGMPLVPGIPAGLQPFVFGRSVNLDWIEPNTPGGATSYDVEIGTSQGGREVAVINTTGLPRNSIGRLAINVPVNPGSYFVRVRGRNASGVGLPTPDQTFFVH